MGTNSPWANSTCIKEGSKHFEEEGGGFENFVDFVVPIMFSIYFQNVPNEAPNLFPMQFPTAPDFYPIILHPNFSC
jgi:hypothetical protein